MRPSTLTGLVADLNNMEVVSMATTSGYPSRKRLLDNREDTVSLPCPRIRTCCQVLRQKGSDERSIRAATNAAGASTAPVPGHHLRNG